MKDFILNALAVLFVIAVVVGLVYFIVWAACWAWGYVCVGVFGWPMLTKTQMLVLMCLINMLNPVQYRGEKS